MTARGIYYTVLTALSVAGAAVAQRLGGWDHLTKLLAWAMAIDYLTGALCAAVWHKSPKTPTGGYESNAGFKGLLRKGVIILIVMVATELDKLSGSTAMRTATVIFFTANDVMSIAENLGIIGVPFPPALANAFEALRGKSGVEDTASPVPTVDTEPQAPYQPQHLDAAESDFVGSDRSDDN